MIRLLTAVVAIPLFYLLLTRLSSLYFQAFAVLVATIGLFEFLSLAAVRPRLRIITLGCGILIMLAGIVPEVSFPALLAVSVLLVVSARLFLDRAPTGALREAGLSLAGLLYVPTLLFFQVLLRERDPAYLVLLYAVVWVSDGLALYAGTLLGRHKLYPSMSPNKTVEGAVGGLIGGALAAFSVNGIYNLMPQAGAVLLGAGLSVAGQIGDLVESMFKRDAGVKDSGALFPGHGGILDKIDASLFAGTALFLVVETFLV